MNKKVIKQIQNEYDDLITKNPDFSSVSRRLGLEPHK